MVYLCFQRKTSYKSAKEMAHNNVGMHCICKSPCRCCTLSQACRVLHALWAWAHDACAQGCASPLSSGYCLCKQVAKMSHLKQVEIIDPLVCAQSIADELAEGWVAEGQPAARGDTIGLVLEPLGPEVSKVLEDGILDDFTVDSCNSIDRVTGHNGKISHPHKPMYTIYCQSQVLQIWKSCFLLPVAVSTGMSCTNDSNLLVLLATMMPGDDLADCLLSCCMQQQPIMTGLTHFSPLTSSMTDMREILSQSSPRRARKSCRKRQLMS